MVSNCIHVIRDKTSRNVLEARQRLLYRCNTVDYQGHSVNSDYPQAIVFLLKWSRERSIRPVGMVDNPIIQIPDHEDSP